jgi:two-component system sensor histidine kinase BaeS
MRFIYSINFKIFLGILITLLVLVGGLVLTIQWSFQRSFLNYVNTAEARFQQQFIVELSDFYAREQSWETLRDNRRLWRQLRFQTFRKAFDVDRDDDDDNDLDDDQPRFLPFPKREFDDDDRDFERRPPEVRKRPRRKPAVALLDSNRDLVVGFYREGPEVKYKPITVDDEIVGYLAVRPLQRLTSRHDRAFSKQLGDMFYLIAAIMAVLAFALSMLLTRPMVRRIRSLKQATHELTAGNYKVKLPTGPRDELGALANDFNLLATTLEKNETARQGWVADISHELRTPISILRGEIEALQDGVREPTPETLERLHQEVMNLERLVRDLYDLSMSDIGALDYQKARCNPHELLQQSIAVFQDEFDEKSIDLSLSVSDASNIYIFADADRIKQLFSNLLINSLRYTDAGGQLHIEMKKEDKRLLIRFSDSAPGVPDEALPHLFDRLYRLDISRNRARGGAGLGLSICKNIVEAHEGTIKALPSPLGGVQIDIELPILD